MQAAPAAASFEDLPIGARGAAMANSHVAHAEGIDGMFMNPAALAGMRKMELYTSFDRFHTGLDDGSSIGRQLFGFGIPFRWGTMALSFDQFALDSLYQENALGFSYGKQFNRNFWFGMGLRQMTVKFGTDEFTSLNPVFESGTSKSAMGIDLGMKFYARKITWGLAIANGNEPDVGIKFSNKVDRRINIGALFRPSDKTNITTAIAQIGSDRKFKFGVERWARKNTLGLRAGVNFGSRDFRNLAFGFGYARKVVTFDYAVTLPLSGLAQGTGTHQLGMKFNWGRKQRRKTPRQKKAKRGPNDKLEAPDEAVTAVLKGPEAEERRKARESLEKARKDLESGRFRAGLKRLKNSDLKIISDAEVQDLKRMMEKAERVAVIYPWVDRTKKAGAAAAKSIDAYMLGDAATAVNAAVYASQKYPKSRNIRKLRRMMEREYPVESFERKTVPGILLTEQLLQESLELIYAGRYVAAIGKCNEVLDLEGDNVLALTRQGSAYWAMGRESTARAVWQRALKLDPKNRLLKKFLKRQTPSKPRRLPKKISDETRDEYRKNLAYYERLKRSGVEKATLRKILKRIIDRFEGSGLQLRYVYDEYAAAGGRE
jgi:tetratricopeptide (TPR) repeat protein